MNNREIIKTLLEKAEFNVVDDFDDAILYLYKTEGDKVSLTLHLADIFSGEKITPMIQWEEEKIYITQNTKQVVKGWGFFQYVDYILEKDEIFDLFYKRFKETKDKMRKSKEERILQKLINYE